MIYDTPQGPLRLASHNGSLCLCDWTESRHHTAILAKLRKKLGTAFKEKSDPVLDIAVRQLDEYFATRRNSLEVPLMPIGTDFQKTVWQALLQIPYGATLSYRDIAAMIGKDNSVRAIANAIGANPLSIFIPCHRVIGADGSLTGYAGGLPAKRHLLSLESQP